MERAPVLGSLWRPRRPHTPARNVSDSRFGRNAGGCGGRDMTNRIRVLVVDDHLVVRKGIRALLATEPDIEVVGEASDGAEAVEEAARLQPDVILMDLVMPQMDGIAAI